MSSSLQGATANTIVAKELPFGQSRLALMFRPLQIIEPGQIVGGPPIVADGAGQQFGAYNPNASDGTENAVGVSVYRIVTTAGSTVRSPVVTCDSEINLGTVVWPAGITATEQDAVVEQLSRLGIAVR